MLWKGGGGGGRGYPSNAEQFKQSNSTGSPSDDDAVLATLKDGGYGNANGTGGKVIVFYMIAP